MNRYYCIKLSNSLFPVQIYLYRGQVEKLAAMLMYSRIHMESYNTSKMLHCDCTLYQLKQFIHHNFSKLVEPYIYRNTLLPDDSNFQSWRCFRHPILGKHNDTLRSFLDVEDEDFICEDDTLTAEGRCPDECKCFTDHNQTSLYISCESRHLQRFPKKIPVPKNENAKLVVSLAHNNISILPECTSRGGDYCWLYNVTTLDLKDNPISIKSHTGKAFDALDILLRCLKKIEKLTISETGIAYLPKYIKYLELKHLSLPIGVLMCDCNTKWLKAWLQKDCTGDDQDRHSEKTFIDNYHDLYCASTGIVIPHFWKEKTVTLLTLLCMP